MNFNHSVQELVRTRISHRTFQNRPIPTDIRETLENTFKNPPKPPFGNRVRLEILEAVDSDRAGSRKLGTYGVIRGARDFLVGVVEQKDHALEDFGFCFEWAILGITDLGLQSCWLGGTLQRDAFGKAVYTNPSEIVPAVSPIGYANEQRSLVDQALRLFAGSKNRKPWDQLFFLDNFDTPCTAQRAEPYEKALEAVRLAPSASNRQPWRVVKDQASAQFHFFLERSSGYRMLTTVDLQRIDLGISMCHFELVSRELRLPGKWTHSTPAGIHCPHNTEYAASWTFS